MGDPYQGTDTPDGMWPMEDSHQGRDAPEGLQPMDDPCQSGSAACGGQAAVWTSMRDCRLPLYAHLLKPPLEAGGSVLRDWRNCDGLDVTHSENTENADWRRDRIDCVTCFYPVSQYLYREQRIRVWLLKIL